MKKEELVSLIINLNENVETIFSELSKEQQKIDLELTDLYHLLENRRFYKLNAPTLAKITSKIAELRNVRRETKEYYSILQSVKPTMNSLSKSVSRIDKSQKNTGYTPRTNIYEYFGIPLDKCVIVK